MQKAELEPVNDHSLGHVAIDETVISGFDCRSP